MKGSDITAVIGSAERDVALLDESLCDLVVALGGTAETSSGLCRGRSPKSSGTRDYSCNINYDRVRYFRKAFSKLDLAVPALLRVLHLHLKRGATLLDHCPSFLKNDTFMHLVDNAKGTNGGPIITSLRDVTGLSGGTLSDLVEGKPLSSLNESSRRKYREAGIGVHDVKLFCSWYVDVFLALYEDVLKRVCTLGIYDCIALRCFFVNLDHILVDHGVNHNQVRNEIYALLLELLNFALQDAWWVWTDMEWLASRLPFIADRKYRASGTTLQVEELRLAISRVAIISGQNGALGASMFRDIVNVFNIKPQEDDAWCSLMGGLQQESRYDEFEMFKRVINDCSHDWTGVLTVSLVTIVYYVLFESFVRQLDKVNITGEIPATLDLLEMLSNLVDLLHETDAAYTAWAVDLLRHKADSLLTKAFKLHEDILIKGTDEGPEGSTYSRLKWGEGICIYVGTLERVSKLFYALVLSLVDKISKPAIDEIGKYWGSKLFWELLYSKDKLFIGPKGKVSDMLRVCSKRVRYSFCAELFARIIAAFAKRVQSVKLDSEAIIFNSLAIWESFCTINNFSSHHQNKNYHLNKLFEVLEKIKMGRPVDPNEPLICAREFWAPLFYVETDMEIRPKHPVLGLSQYILGELKGVLSVDNVVWVQGAFRSRAAIFGDALLLFSDESSLQPVRIIDLYNVSAISCPGDSRKHVNALNSLESDMEIYSCGTTDTEMNNDEDFFLDSCISVEGGRKSLLHWGWRMILEMDSSCYSTKRCALNNDMGSFHAVEFEFMGPEHRERWLRSLKAVAKPRVSTDRQGNPNRWCS